jgi:quinohemoprotein ethanol dehydrogenase
MSRVKLDQIRISLARCSLAIIRASIAISVMACAPAFAQDRAAIEAGEQVYDEHCASCHGVKLRPTGAMPDLKQQKADGRARFDQIVMSGKNQMPAWQGVVSPEELDQIWAYIRSRAADR